MDSPKTADLEKYKGTNILLINIEDTEETNILVMRY